MVLYVEFGHEQYIPVGQVVIYSFLLLFTLLCYAFRFSKMPFQALFFTLATTIFGLLNGIFLLYLSVNQTYTSGDTNLKVLLASMFFAQVAGSFAWMAGIAVFSVFLKEKKKAFVYVGYLLTLIELVLSIVAIVFYSKLSYATTYYTARSNYVLYFRLYKALVVLRWVYFLLFIALLVQTKDSVSRLGKISLIVFMVLNTARLIVNCVFLGPLNFDFVENGVRTVDFFMSDFLTVISLLLIVAFWKKIILLNKSITDK